MSRIYDPGFGQAKEDISFLIPGAWYWVKNRGVWRGPMQWKNPEWDDDQKEWGFWFPEWTGEFQKVNFSLAHIDCKSVRTGVRLIEEPDPKEANWILD